MFPLKKKTAEMKAAQSLRHEAHQAEHIAKHEERMAKIEEMRASSLERRMAAITKSAELAKRIEKENKAVEEKNNSMAKPAMAQSNDNVFYARIKSNRLNRRGQPYEFTDTAKTKHNLLDRIRRNRSK
jgi:chemotaxis regulatin CheY-phosphate phosphatase CheZ